MSDRLQKVTMQSCCEDAVVMISGYAQVLVSNSRHQTTYKQLNFYIVPMNQGMPHAHVRLLLKVRVTIIIRSVCDK